MRPIAHAVRIGTLAALLLLSTGSAQAGPIVNGMFTNGGGPPTQPFPGWTTAFGIYSAAPTDGGGFALFADNTSSSVELEQTFALPANALSLRFEFQLTTMGMGASGNPDSFQATLYDSVFDPILPANGRTAFYSITRTGSEIYDPLVSVDDLGGGLRRVTLDLRGVPPQDLLLEFLLNGPDDGFTTTVVLDNVDIALVPPNTAVPEPSSALVFGAVVAFLAVGSRTRRRSPLPSANAAHSP